MNIPLLRKVQAAILAEPTQFDMSLWFKRTPKSNCGTAACIAGHAVAIERKFPTLKVGCLLEPSDVEGPARSVLELNLLQAENLFFRSSWPEPFFEAYTKATDPKDRARIASERIDHFIATEGRE